jgi:hypothetical protein
MALEMKTIYNKTIKLQCTTCGGEDFTSSEDESCIKCNLCNREYFGGYNELKECNQERIDAEIEATKKEIEKDVVREINDIFRKAFKR